MADREPAVNVLPASELEPFLERYRHDTGIPDSIDAGFFIREVLDRAREFVPCEAGSVLLDHPFERAGDPEGCALYFIAAFGPAATGRATRGTARRFRFRRRTASPSSWYKRSTRL